MNRKGILRLRCPADIKDPRHPEKHFAVDVRLPLTGTKRNYLADALGDCSCGLQMVVLSKSEDPWIRT